MLLPIYPLLLRICSASPDLLGPDQEHVEHHAQGPKVGTSKGSAGRPAAALNEPTTDRGFAP